MRQFLSKFAAIISAPIGALHLWLSWIAIYSQNDYYRNYAGLTFFIVGIPLAIVQLFLVIVIAIANKGRGVESGRLRMIVPYVGTIASLIAMIIFFK